jgi:hypothetical protein
MAVYPLASLKHTPREPSVLRYGARNLQKACIQLLARHEDSRESYFWYDQCLEPQKKGFYLRATSQETLHHA